MSSALGTDRRAVCIESPLKGDIARNVRYADACMLDALERGEAPFLGHLLYPRVLSDFKPEHRESGIGAHLTWLRRADVVVVYGDLGVSSGMQAAIDLAESIGIPVEYRLLGDDWEQGFGHVTGTPGFR